MIRLGLCCIFRDEPIKFRTTTAAAIARLSRTAAMTKLARLCRENAAALEASLRYCGNHSIGCFRINSQILPLKTHPQHGYEVRDLPEGDDIVRQFQRCGELARQLLVRTCFHPDQFVVLNSQRPDVVEASLKELEYQAEVAEWVGADVINIHGGGAFGDKSKALGEFSRNLERLSPRARQRLTVENDDKLYSPADLLPVCRATGVPLVYDVHHHRCHRDQLSVQEATDQAMVTWDREPLFHLSSPLDGWQCAKPERHHDFINVADFPDEWLELDLTVEIEAKAKEVAVRRLADELKRRMVTQASPTGPTGEV